MYRKIKSNEVPKRARRSVSRFEGTAEWKAMRADIDKGLKPNEALQVILTPEDKKRYRLRNRRTVARFIRKYITSHKLPYAVQSFNRDGQDFFIVRYTPVIRQTA